MDDIVPVFKVLSHPLRLEVLELLSEESRRYTDVLEELDVETGKLNFHLRKLDGYVESGDDDFYRLTERGVRALEAVDRASEVSSAAPVVWEAPSVGGVTPMRRLKALAVDAALFVGTPFVASVLILLSIPVQLSAEGPLIYLLAGLNPVEHLLTGTLLLLVATTVGEAYSGRTPGKSVVGIRVVRGNGHPDLPVSLARAICTVYLLPIDFLAARVLGTDALRFTDEALDIEVVEGGDESSGGRGGSGRRVSTPSAEVSGS